jgi:2-aminoadipate transaminase
MTATRARLRLSFVTSSVEEIDIAIAALAETLREELALLGDKTLAAAQI